jgi:hypothetical protein
MLAAVNSEESNNLFIFLKNPIFYYDLKNSGGLLQIKWEQ